MGKVSFGELVDSEATPLPESEAHRPAKEISFAEIICPEGGSIEESAFVRHFCSKQMLHIAQDDRTRFEHLLSWQTINDLLSLNLLMRGHCALRATAETFPRRCIGGKTAKWIWWISRKLHDLLKQNASVAINVVHISTLHLFGAWRFRWKLPSGQKV